MDHLPQENLKEFGRKLGKVGHGDPLTLFSTMLSQIEVYNNMIGMMVGAMKYLTDIGCAPPHPVQLTLSLTSHLTWMSSGSFPQPSGHTEPRPLC